MPELYDPVYAFVRTVPAGKVVTYGQVAGMVTETSFTARQVGNAMKQVPEDVPWHRVVGVGGTLPIARMSPEHFQRQRELLRGEGVVFKGDSENRVDMKTYQWMPDYLYNSESELSEE